MRRRWKVAVVDYAYTVVLLQQEEGGYSVVVPALSGCFTEGDTVPEALNNAQEAMQCHLESLDKHDEPMPNDVTTVEFEWGESAEALVYRVNVVMPEAATVA